MTRQQAFDRGLLTVKDLDDEELRAGKCRGPDGKIPRNPNKTEPIPRDIYDEMVAEHEARFNQRLREKLDTMIDVMTECAMDDTAEWRDRLAAAQYIFERTAGKTPERVQLHVTKAPWEEMLQGIAQITREQSQKQRAGEIIDAEVEEFGRLNDPAAPNVGRPSVARVGVEDGIPRAEAEAPQDATKPVVPPEVFQQVYPPAEPAPSHDAPANSSVTIPPKEYMDKVAAAKDLAKRRKEAKERIKAAKKRRIVARNLGLDVLKGTSMVANESAPDDEGNIQIRFDAIGED